MARSGRPGGNPEIAKIGHQSQFGKDGGPDPKAAADASAKKRRDHYSLRESVKRLARAPIKTDQPVGPQIENAFGSPGLLTVAQMLAIKKVGMALRGDMTAMKEITEDIDGKLVQKAVTATTPLEQLVNGSYDRQQVDDDDGD